MTPAEYAQKLPVWVIPESVDLVQLRSELKILLRDYEKSIHFVPFYGWSHLHEQPRDPAVWSGFLSGYEPFNQLCTAAKYLKGGAMQQVLRATVPTDTWTVVIHLRVDGDFPMYRTIRLEWLKLLERKLYANV